MIYFFFFSVTSSALLYHWLTISSLFYHTAGGMMFGSMCLLRLCSSTHLVPVLDGSLEHSDFLPLWWFSLCQWWGSWEATLPTSESSIKSATDRKRETALIFILFLQRRSIDLHSAFSDHCRNNCVVGQKKKSFSTPLPSTAYSLIERKRSKPRSSCGVHWRWRVDCWLQNVGPCYGWGTT